jgi:hypothetical protein
VVGHNNRCLLGQTVQPFCVAGDGSDVCA